MNRLIYLCLLFGTAQLAIAQSKPADTIVVKIGNASKMVLTVNDRRDLETMKYYNFQALISDLIKRLEESDTAKHPKPADAYRQPIQKTDSGTPQSATSDSPRSTDEVWYSTWPHRKVRKYNPEKRTTHSLNFDLGTNNYLQGGNFVDGANSPYTVRPWGSWYVGINSIQRTRLANKLFVEWGVGVSWYNFKFQNDNLRIIRTPDQLIFEEDMRGFEAVKSKLTASYLNASFVPVIDFGGNRRKPSLVDGYNGSNSLRVGAGVYAGYRIGSYTKFVYDDGGDNRRDRDTDNYYLNNLRYGVRAQIGFNDVDFFFSYDLNDLFIANRGPQLNAFSFGVTF
jgi:hypothetical protein